MAERERELLSKAGIHVAVLDEKLIREQGGGKIRTQCVRAAIEIKHRNCRTVGLLPASAEVSVVGAGVNLAVAMAEVTGSTVAYVDANSRWPALSQLLDGDDDADPTQPFATRWLRGDVALLVPRHAEGTAGLNALQKVLTSSEQLFTAHFVDLTGWRRVGEHLAAYDLLDGVAIVAVAGVTTERELLQLGQEIPPGRDLGVLLLGADELA